MKKNGGKRGGPRPNSGRPKAEINWAVVTQFGRAQCKLGEICAYLGISRETLNERCKAEYGITSENFIMSCREGGLVELRVAQWRSACVKGNAQMLKFLGVNYLGQTDGKGISDTEEEFGGASAEYMSDAKLEAIARGGISESNAVDRKSKAGKIKPSSNKQQP